MTSFETLRDTTLFLASHLASFVALGVSAWVYGETILRRAAICRGKESWAVAATLGWGLIVQSMFVLGVLELLERWLVLGLLGLGHLVCHGTWRGLFTGRQRPGSSVAAACLVALPCFAFTLYPPTGFDATVYHLPYARAFVEAGALQFLPDLRFPVFPQAGEMGFVLGLFLSGEIAAKLTQLLAMLLTAGLLFEWGRLYSRRAAIWAAALWLGNPLVVWLGASAYIDITLALFITASFFCWERWSRDRDRRWLWLAGGFGGLAASTKYLGLFFLAALGIMTVLHSCKPRGLKLRDARPLIALSAVALAVLAPWYLRIVYHTGNPIFPFYAPIFGASEWTSLHDQALPSAEPATTTFWSVAASQGDRILEGLSFLARVPWAAVFDRGIFHWQAPMSPWYLLLLPLCAPIGLLKPGTRWLLVVVAIYGLFWLTTVRDLRFLVAGIPLLNIALAATLDGLPFLSQRLRRLASPFVTLLLLAPGPLYAGYKIHKQGWPPVGTEQRTAYLTRQVDAFQAIHTINQLEGRDYTVYALYGEYLRYYADGRFAGDWFGPGRFSRIEAVLGDSGALANELQHQGACFFLVRHARAHALLAEGIHPSRKYFKQVSAGDGYLLYRLTASVCSRQRPG